MDSPNDDETAMLELLNGESSVSQSSQSTQTETTTAPVMTVVNASESPSTQEALTETDYIGAGYHVWQNLSTGECVLRPVQPSPSVGIPPSTTLTGQLPPSTEIVLCGECADRLRSGEAKRVRISWTGELQKIFEQAVKNLGSEATPKPIMKVIHVLALPSLEDHSFLDSA